MTKVLIADDSRFQVGLISSWLQAKGLEVVTAADALQAWMIALRTLPDIILLDINMPGGTGVQVLKRLRNSVKTQHIRVIVISGNEDRDVQAVVEELGAAAFLTKPVGEAQLCDVIAQVLTKPVPGR